MAKIYFIPAALVACCLLLFGWWESQRAADQGTSHAVTIMTFNVENLFDNHDDEGKNDETYLALTDKQTDEHRILCAKVQVERWRDQCLNWDWNDEIVERKLRVVAQAILQINDGRGPDIIALQEVENIGILERLRTQYLSDADYLPAILIEGDDARGIDVAFLSRFELATPATLHPITFDVEYGDRVADTRGILQADFRVPDGTVLTGYAVHFPAPFHPTAMRIAAYGKLNELQARLPGDRPAFAAGDFNTTSREDRDKNMLERFVRPSWTVAHDFGCGDCRGTSYYAGDDSWSFLDMIIWSPAQNRGAHATWDLRKNPVQIANRSADQLTAEGTPARFSMPSGNGVSDHWPVVVTLESK